jgi:hypothetical protein
MLNNAGSMPILRHVALAALAVAIFSAPARPQTDDPQRVLWMALKRQLTGPDAQDYFKSSVHHSVLPPLKGTLISALINPGVSKLTVGLTDSSTPEVTLILHNGNVKWKSDPRPGAQIEFEGVAVDFRSEPFMLTFDVPIGQIKGLEFERTNPKK